jgi:hypothetical protein
MVARYRVVHFVPDPFTGARIPVAAIVEGAKGLTLAPAGHLPGASCLGANPTYATMQMVLESLSSIADFRVLPISVGPHAVLDMERQVPADVSDPVAWVVENILPRAAASERVAVAAKNTRRDTQGYRFFETWNVAQYVHQHFQPGESWTGARPKGARMLGPVSHWAGSPKGGVLLMEPLIPSRPKFEDELAKVYQRFAGYRIFLNGGDAPVELRKNTKLCVYVLQGGNDKDRSSALSAFADVDATTVDLENESARGLFVDEIRTLGRAAEPQTKMLGGQAN